MREVRLRGGDSIHWCGKTLSALYSGQDGPWRCSVPNDAPLFDLRLQLEPVVCIWAREWDSPDATVLRLSLDGLSWIQED